MKFLNHPITLIPTPQLQGPNVELPTFCSMLSKVMFSLLRMIHLIMRDGNESMLESLQFIYVEKENHRFTIADT